MKAARRVKPFWASFLWLLLFLFLIEGLASWGATASLPPAQGSVTEVRTLYPREWGVPHPSGLVYASGDDEYLILLADVSASDPISEQVSLVTITPYEDLVSAVTVPVAVEDTANIAYDALSGHLLLLDATDQVVQIPLGSDGIPDAGQLVRADVSHLGLGWAAGMAVDPAARQLLILDQQASAVVIADLAHDFAPVTHVDLTQLAATDLRGLAIHPGTGTLFVTSPSQGLIFEVTISGSLLNSYELASLAPLDLRGLAFGPSADLTDPPDTIHIFLADSGVYNPPAHFGRIVEAMLKPLPTPGDTTLRFAVIGDYGRDNTAEAEVAALVHSWNPDFIITTGDNNYPDGEAATMDDNVGKYFSQYIGNYQGEYGPGSPTNRFWPTLGNHDWHTMTCDADQCSSAYLDYFTLPNNERYYTVDLGLVRLFALDSEQGEPDGRDQDSIQAEWLRTQLAASTACYNVVFLHRPPYGSGRHGAHTVVQWPFADWGAQAILSGHDHLYERLEAHGIPYFVNGAGGGTLYDFEEVDDLPPEATSVVRFNQDHGAMLVTASPTGITYQFYTVDGVLIDDYTETSDCAAVPATATPTITVTPGESVLPTPTSTLTATSALTPTATATSTVVPVTATVGVIGQVEGSHQIRLPLVVK